VIVWTEKGKVKREDKGETHTEGTAED